MVVVEIRWYIKPTLLAALAFLWYWREKAKIAEKHGLFREFMNMTIEIDPDRYPADSQNPHPEKCWLFKNIGVWRSEEDFYQQIGRHIKPDSPLLPCEAFRRSRTVMQNLESREGEWFLPAATCE